MKRRTFLKNTGLASAALWAPSFLNHLPGQTNGKILIVIQLSGGNDGLNTIVPYRNDKYYELRPDLAISDSEVLRVTDELGFNPSLSDLQTLYDEGWVSIVNNVGYPNPNRSHFRSMDIWQTASDSREYLTSGWLGRYLDSQCSGCESPHYALELGQGLSLA
ncbi:MAG: twin-arginine translocation pathway signal, partial [Bacteroidota bacterium]